MALRLYTDIFAVSPPPLWPHLAARRNPPLTPISHSTASDTPNYDVPTLLVALARVLGFLADASTVLIAVQHDEQAASSSLFHLLSIDWNDPEKTWKDAIESVTAELSHHADLPPATLPLLQQILSLTSHDTLCLPVCSLSQCNPIDGIPLSIDLSGTTTKNSSGSFICHSNESYIHPSMLGLLSEHIQALYSYAINTPDASLAHLPTLPESLSSSIERDLTFAPPNVQTVTDHIRLRAATLPEDHQAIRSYPRLNTDNLDFDAITYTQLHLQSNQYAHWLIRNGLEPQDRVAVSMPRTIPFHLALLAIIKAGACYVPIDPELPFQRKSYIVRDSGAKFVLTTSDLPVLAPDVQHFCLDREHLLDSIAAENQFDIQAPSPDGLAYLLYTSGTTGDPKGCLLTNDGLSQAIWAISEYASDVRIPDFQISDLTKARYLGVASIAFDVHLAETFVPFVHGMTLVTAPRSTLFEDLPGYILSLGITHVGIVPSLIEATMGAMEDTDDTMPLRYIASGGEKMSDAILDKWASHPAIRLANFYGPSEVTIGCCARAVDSTTPKSNIGRSFPNVSSFVVDADLRVLPRGAMGELVVEGPLVGQGYHNKPELTQKAFLPWTLSSGTQGWAYRTGDLVRMMPDGSLEISGRIDTQIKLRGVRIEAEGVSAIVRKAQAKLDACTILARHPSIGSDQLVTFVSTSDVSVSKRKSAPPSIEEISPELLARIHDFCDRELASYMRPSHVVLLSWLPLSSNGKSHEKLMRKLFEQHDYRQKPSTPARSSPQPPLTDVEKRILEVVAKYGQVDVNRCSGQTSLFECGLDSITVIRFTKDLNASFTSHLSAPQVMANPRVAELATLLEQSTQSSTSKTSFSISFSDKWKPVVCREYPTDSVERILPTLSIQPGVIFRSSGTSAMYVQHVVIDCVGADSSEKLQNAWTQLMHENPIMRTVFFSGEVLAQVVLAKATVQLPWSKGTTPFQSSTDFSRWFLAERAEDVAREINETVATKPLFRLNEYARVAPSESTSSTSHPYLVLSIHHALFDGISLPKLIASVEKLSLGQDVATQATLSQVVDAVYDVDQQAAKEFWSAQFKDFAWPARSRQISATGQAKKGEVAFQKSLSFFKDLASQRQITLQSLLTCAYASLAARRLLHSEDVVFGTIRSCRLLNVEGIEDAPYPTITVVPTRVNLRTSDDVLLHVQRTIGKMVQFEHIGLADIQNWVRPGRALFDTLFSVSVKEKDELNRWKIAESEPPKPDYLLSVEVVLDFSLDTIKVQAAWIADDFQPNFVETFLADFEETAEDLVKNGSSTPSGSIASEQTLCSQLDQQDAWSTEDLNTPLVKVADLDPHLLAELRSTISKTMSLDESNLDNDMSFIALGLDSIKSIGLARALKGLDLGVAVSAVDIMQNATVHRLAAHIQSLTAVTPTDHHGEKGRKGDAGLLQELVDRIDVDTLKQHPEDGVRAYPTTALQAGMLSQTLTTEGQLYVHIFPLRLENDVDFSALQAAWTAATRLLPILRTSFRFSVEHGIWIQVVHSEHSSFWSEDIFTSDTDYQEKVAQFRASLNFMGGESGQSPPPAYCRLYTAQDAGEDSAARLVLIMHHALYDGISLDLLFNFVQSLYRKEDVLASTPFHQILPHLLDQEERGANYWTEKLKPFAPFDFQTLPEKAHVQLRSVDLPATPTSLREVCRLSAVTLQSLCQAVFAKWLASIYSYNDVIFGRVVSGRTLPGAEDVIGPVLNTVPCVLQIQEGLTNGEFMRSVQEASTEAMPWQHASLRTIQKRMGVHSRLWDVLFVFQPKVQASSTSPIWQFDSSGGYSEEIDVQYPLNVELHETEAGLTFKVACRSDHFTSEELDEKLQRFATIFQQFIDHPDDAVQKDLPKLKALSKAASSADGRTLSSSDSRTTSYTPLPKILVKILATCTRVPVENITSSSTLASLGIDSIMAIQIASKCRSAGFRLTAKNVTSSRYVGDLVRANGDHSSEVRAAQDTPETVLRIPEKEKAAVMAHFTEEEVEDVYPTSPGMKWLLAGWQASRGTRFQYSFAWRLPEDVDIPRLKEAWLTLLEMHPILRSAFHQAAEYPGPHIVLLKLGAVRNRVWSEVRSDNLEVDVVETMKGQMDAPSSLSSCQTRAILLSSSTSRAFVVHFHHAQYDGWSLQLIVDHLQRLYNKEKLDSRKDLVQFLRSLPSEHDRIKQKNFWVSHLASLDRCSPFPSLSSSAPETTLSRTLYIDKSAFASQEDLNARARSLEVSVSAILLAAWAKIHTRRALSEGSVFGLWSASRPGLEELVVPCMNVLPFLVKDARDSPLPQLAVKINEALRERDALIEQSELLSVGEWVNARRKPISNVNINIVKLAPDVSQGEQAGSALLDPIQVPFYTPPPQDPWCDADLFPMPTTLVFSDELSIDIVIPIEGGPIAISIDASTGLLQEHHARDLVEEWKAVVGDEQWLEGGK